jgi:ferritin-like metal-binding protein YciE
MALNNPRDLFLYEMAGMYDAETKSKDLLGQMAGQVQEPTTADTLRLHLEDGQQKIRNLEQCFEAMGASPQRVPCAVMDGMQADAQQFMSQNPSPDLVTAFALGTAMKMDHYAQAAYAGLVDKAISMGEARVADSLQTNKLQAKDGATTAERLAHDLDQRMMAAA